MLIYRLINTAKEVPDVSEAGKKLRTRYGEAI